MIQLTIYAKTANSPEENKDSYPVPLWILSPGEEKTLLKEHQAWTETQCQAQFTGTLILWI